jgi:hypothetical protein
MPCQPAQACNTYPNSTTCNLATGCEWDIANQVCIVKMMNGCVDSVVKSQCQALVGCLWTDANVSCIGTATPCGSISDATACANQMGCMAP